MRNLINIKQVLFALLLLTVGCKKDPVSVPPPTPIAQELAIHFSAETIPLQNVDSAIVIVRDAGHSIKKRVRLQSRTNALYTSFTDLAAGVYTGEIMIYTKREPDNTARQFAFETTFTLPLPVHLNVKGPTGSFITDTWFKRAVLFAPAEEATAIIAMDARDAFYEIKFKEAQWDYSRLQRYALFDNAVIAEKTHMKSLQGIIGVADYTTFNSYTQQMQGKLWTKASISLYIRHLSGREIVLDYDYN